MKRLKISILGHAAKLIAMLMLYSCSGNKPEPIPNLIFNYKDTVAIDEANLADYLHLDRAIVLETTNESLISNIRKIIIRDDYIFILTWGRSTIFIFDSNGLFINKIEAIGKGPGEYIQIVDFDIDNSNNLWLYDQQLKSLYIYDIEGNSLDVIDLALTFESFCIVEDTLILGYSFLNFNPKYSNSNYSLWLMSKKGKILNGFLPIPESILGFSLGLPSSINNNNGSVTICPFTSDTIYKFDSSTNQVFPVFFMDFGNSSLPADYLYQNKQDLMENLNNSCIAYGSYFGKTCFISNLYKKQDRKRMIAIYDFNTNNSVISNKLIFHNEANNLHLSADFQSIDYSGNGFVCIVQLIDQDGLTKQDNSIFPDDYSIDDNPIIVIFN